MLDNTWRSLKNLFQSPEGSKIASSPGDSKEIPSLSDEDFAFLFEQLLEGVSHGWQTSRVQRFFEQLGEQGRHGAWVDWLQRYYAPKVLGAPVPDLELAQKLFLLAQQTQYIPKIMEVGALSNALSQALQTRSASNEIWEYGGADADAAFDGPQPQYVSIEELLAGMRQDENLARDIASQLGVSETDPETIIRLLLERLQLDNPDTTAE